MTYKFVTENESWEDLASGRVLYNAHGTTAFPVRLASEIYLRGKAHLKRKGREGKLTVYDPCCGGAHWLTAVGMLHGRDLSGLFGTDVDPRAVDIAKMNLSLLHEEGLNKRISQIQALYDSYGKESHRQALESAMRLKRLIAERGPGLETDCLQADATRPLVWPNSRSPVDLVLTDVPYGETVRWSSEGSGTADPLERMLEQLLAVVRASAVVAVVADKKQTIAHDGYRRLERSKIGKRQIVFLEPVQ